MSTYVSGSIRISPAVPAELIPGGSDRLEYGEEAQLVAVNADFSEITAAGEGPYRGNIVFAAVEAIVERLGTGYTYTDCLECSDVDNPGNQWRIRVDATGTVVEENGSIVYPGDALLARDMGPLTAALTAADIEAALVTLAELWNNPDADLSERQTQVGLRVSALFAEMHQG